MDQWEISTAEIEYGVNILHVMETTKFLSTSQLSWDAKQWPVWANADYVWKRVAFSTHREHGNVSDKYGHFSPVVTSAYSMNRLMLFSENRQVSTFSEVIVGGIIQNILQYFLRFSRVIWVALPKMLFPTFSPPWSILPMKPK